jgi:signal transduction histidine kinase
MNAARYVGLLAAAYAVAGLGAWFFGQQLDRSAYDFMLRLHQPTPWKPQSVILAIDEATLRATAGGMNGIRGPLARAFRLLGAAKPAVVASDVIITSEGLDAAVDAGLAESMRTVPNLVLPTELSDSGWDHPRKAFSEAAAAIAHVQAAPDPDGVTRSVPLEIRSGRERYWAMSLEAFRLSRGAPIVESSDGELRVGGVVIAVPGSRHMRVYYVRPGIAEIPRVSLQGLLENPALAARFAGKVVFLGATAAAAGDRFATPLSGGRQTNGVEIHASAFETMARGLFIRDVTDLWVALFGLLVVAAMGIIFQFLPGWRAYAAGTALLAGAQLAPYALFTGQRLFPFSWAFFPAWLGFVASAGHYHLVVRKRLLAEQSTRARYQQAMHFVTHEMRTPLSAIQGSSELISRFALTEEKRKQVALLINSESKRLARMVEIFLNVERLSAGQMELKREAISVKELLEVCLERTRPLAERKHIAISLEPVGEAARLTGDRELMEYACYNLLTNAVKYSPQQTEVVASAWLDGPNVRIAVKDQGIGMDQKEVKQIFRKFYRTKKAEESGEAGTGIGLSIVQQIVEQHGGRIDVTSEPGVGSCFTVTLPAAREAAPAAERS